MNFPEKKAAVIQVPAGKNIRIFLKREDLIHPDISGNKYWKLFYNIRNYRQNLPKNPLLATFGGAYSNHILAVAALGRDCGIRTLGIIRGEELWEKISENPTLLYAEKMGMSLRFVSREEYRHKDLLAKEIEEMYPESLVIPEGGTNALAVEGVRHMLSEETAQFDYLCAAVGTGGTLAGISKFAAGGQKVLGFAVVRDSTLPGRILELSSQENFEIVDASFGGYGKISDDVVAFINKFYQDFKIPLDPVYTGKMMKRIFDMAAAGFFPGGSKILAFHTGGLQGIAGANKFLSAKGRLTINFNY